MREGDEGHLKGVRDNEESLKRGGELLGVDSDGDDETVVTGAQETVPDDVVRGELHDCGFEGADGQFAECCNHSVSEGGVK